MQGVSQNREGVLPFSTKILTQRHALLQSPDKRDLSRFASMNPNRQLPASPVKSPLQPVKRQGNIKLGQLRKLCLYGGVLPRRYKPLILKEYLMRSFRGRFFRPCGIFEEGRISGFWGDVRGLSTRRDLMLALSCRAKQARYSRGGLLFPVGWDRTSFQTAVISTTASGRDSNGVVANLFAIAIKMRRFSLGSLTESITPSPATET